MLFVPLAESTNAQPILVPLVPHEDRREAIKSGHYPQGLSNDTSAATCEGGPESWPKSHGG